MARKIKAVTKSVFGFTSVEIYPGECLGSGAYGAVCKALCDELPCAAKILHSALFQFNDPGMSTMMARFHQECELMGRIRHPCIVQYLGTVEDPETQRPILLMELMDESLTKFLERSSFRLAYHVQVNINYDVTLALSYLHSNRVLHRDLSSNNILISAGIRAKVTDFGMLKLLEQNKGIISLTKCPGTVAYMPPEALSDEPAYTNKLDCFSLGVLMIQIITRNFPEPTKATLTVYDPKYPTGRVLVPVPEVERRKKDVNLIDACHPIRPIALDCIKDNERERPLANEVCSQLSNLRSKEEYSESLRGEDHVRDSTFQIEMQRLREESAQANREKDLEINDLRRQISEFQMTNRDCATDDLIRKLRELQMTIEEKVNEIEGLQQQLYKYETKNPKWRLTWNEKLKVSTRRAMWRGGATSVESLAFFNPGLTGIVFIYDSTTNDWSELPRCMHTGFTLVAINNIVTAVGGNKELYTTGSALLCFSEGKWVEKFRPMPTKRYFPAAVCTADTLVVAGGCGQDCQSLMVVEIMDTNTIQWSTVVSLPVGISSASMAACGDRIYLLGDDTNNVYSCSLKELLRFCDESKTADKNLEQTCFWTRTADLPVSRSTAVTICGQLVSVGGYDANGEVDTIYCYDSRRNIWEKAGELLSVKGLPLATALPGDKLVVVHGNHKRALIGTATATTY